MESFAVGSLAIPTRPFFFLVAVLGALAVGNRLAKRSGMEVERALWSVLFVGVASARLAFVLIYWPSYIGRPWTVLDLRDGGMNVVVGIAGAIFMALFLAVRNRPQRRPILASLMVGLALWGAMTTALQAGKATTPIPAITLPDLGGKSVALQSFTGKPVIINLWASWCPPCRREMPVLQEAQKTHKDIIFVFANQGESADAVRAYLIAHALQMENVLIDRHGAIAKQARAAGLPTTLFFDRHGTLVDTRIGELSHASLEERLTKLVSP